MDFSTNLLTILLFICTISNKYIKCASKGSNNVPELYDESLYEESGDDSVEAEHIESIDDLELNKDYLRTIPQAYNIIYPLQIRKNKPLETLSTKDSRGKDTHSSHAAFSFPVNGKVVKIRLELNRELFSQGLKQKFTLDTKTSVIQESTLESCYYQGHVRKVDKSYAAFSTCQNGLSGVVFLNNESYVLEPLAERKAGNKTIHPHVIYKTIPAPEKSCGNDHGMWRPYQELHMAEFLRRLKIMRTNKSEMTVLTEYKYVDLGMVMDHAMYKKFNSSYSTAWTYAAQLVNIVDIFLQKYKLRVNLAFTEVWNLEDQIELTKNSKETLQNFMVYRQKSMKALSLDVAVLVTGGDFGTDVGMAIPDSVCTDRSAAVVQDPSPVDITQVAATVSHMISHTLGINHNHQPECKCEDSFGCIMDENPMGISATHPYHLGNCSQKDLNGTLLSGFGTCLYKDNIENSFSQECGNGKVERGEECDCGNRGDCALTDPCCDPHTCLLKPWATCQRGDCCYNCTVLPKTQMCRAPETECDVPEFCDGLMGTCPSNLVVQDGQPCKDRASYCFNGYCNTYDGQCRTIWGQDAIASVDNCYEKFNPTGNFNGHCGFNSTSNSYIKCKDENIKCGLLHCSEGRSRPRFSTENTFSHTHIVSEGKEFQCKILNDVLENKAPIGLVRDGTKCSEDKMCLHSKCVPVASIVKEACPVGENGKLCSGNGICTNEAKCFCFHKYSGNVCQNYQSITTPSPTTVADSLDTMPVIMGGGAAGGLWNSTVIPVIYKGKLVTPAEDRGDTAMLVKSNIPTMWLIIVLASVAGGACLLMCCCLLCYRRRSPRSLKKKKLGYKGCKGDSGSDIERGPRLISFGNLPSYRADKIKKAMRKSVAGQSETGSEHSAIGNDRGSREINIAENFPNLPSPPEKGILKKGSKKKQAARSLDNLQKNSATTTDQNNAYELKPPMKNTFEPPRHRWMNRYGVFGLQNSPRHSGISASDGNISPIRGLQDTTVAMIQQQSQQQQESDSSDNQRGNSDCGGGNREVLLRRADEPNQDSIYEGLRDSYYRNQNTDIYGDSGGYGAININGSNRSNNEGTHQYDQLLKYNRNRYSGTDGNIESECSDNDEFAERVKCENYNEEGGEDCGDNYNNDDDENIEICSQCSECSVSPTTEKKSYLCASELDLSDLEYIEDDEEYNNGDIINEARNVQTQTDDLVSPLLSIKSSSSSVTSPMSEDNKDSLEGTKNRIIKLKNINDLLKQIDEQFNTVLKQTQDNKFDCDDDSDRLKLSPANSDDLARCSETEVDRQYGDSYYRQSDIEADPTSSSRSSYVSNTPSVTTGKGSNRNSSRVTSSVISSPDPLPSPGCIVSPIGGGAVGGENYATPIDYDSLALLDTFNVQRHSTPKVKGVGGGRRYYNKEPQSSPIKSPEYRDNEPIKNLLTNSTYPNVVQRSASNPVPKLSSVSVSSQQPKRPQALGGNTAARKCSPSRIPLFRASSSTGSADSKPVITGRNQTSPERRRPSNGSRSPSRKTSPEKQPLLQQQSQGGGSGGNSQFKLKSPTSSVIPKLSKNSDDDSQYQPPSSPWKKQQQGSSSSSNNSGYNNRQPNSPIHQNHINKHPSSPKHIVIPVSSPQSPKSVGSASPRSGGSSNSSRSGSRTDILTAVPYRGANKMSSSSSSSIGSSPTKCKLKLDLTGSGVGGQQQGNVNNRSLQPVRPDLAGLNPLTRSMSAVEPGSSKFREGIKAGKGASGSALPKGGGPPPYQRQLTDPTLDGYPFKGSPSGDLHSLSEGYYSDSKPPGSESGGDMEDSVIVREIPRNKPSKLQLKAPSSHGADAAGGSGSSSARGSKYISSPEDINV